jgi:hypothetical protein
MPFGGRQDLPCSLPVPMRPVDLLAASVVAFSAAFSVAAAAFPQEEPGYWYYCQSAREYYPKVPSCAESWIKVSPRHDRPRAAETDPGTGPNEIRPAERQSPVSQREDGRGEGMSSTRAPEAIPQTTLNEQEGAKSEAPLGRVTKWVSTIARRAKSGRFA